MLLCTAHLCTAECHHAEHNTSMHIRTVPCTAMQSTIKIMTQLTAIHFYAQLGTSCVAVHHHAHRANICRAIKQPLPHSNTPCWAVQRTPLLKQQTRSIGPKYTQLHIGNSRGQIKTSSKHKSTNCWCFLQLMQQLRTVVWQATEHQQAQFNSTFSGSSSFFTTAVTLDRTKRPTRSNSPYTAVDFRPVRCPVV